MLRLAPTQITLGSRDLTWHTRRHNHRREREKQHASGFIEVIGSSTKGPQHLVEKPVCISPFSVPRVLPANEPVTTANFDTASISREPVSRDSRVFWDQVLADAGAPTGTQIRNVERRPRIVEMPRDSQGMIPSSKGSIDENFPGSAGTYKDSFGIGYPQNPSSETETIPQLQSRFSSESDTSFQEDSKTEVLVSNNDTEELRQFVLPIRSSSMASYSGRFLRPTSQEDRAITSHSSSGHPDLDGYSGSLPAHHDYHRKGTSTTWMKSGYDDSRSAAQTSRIATGPSVDRASSPENPSSPQLPLPRSVDNIRRRPTSGLPRSPLYMSQAAASSSPEKRTRPSADLSDENSSSETVAEHSRLPVEPPRHRKKYRARYEGYIYDEAASETAEVYGIDGLSIDDSIQSSLPTSSLSSRTASVCDHQQASPQPQNRLSGSSSASSRRTTSPNSYPALSTPGNTVSSPSPPRRNLPPHPFSATQRNVSYGLPLSPASPSASNPTVSPLPQSRPPRTPQRTQRMAVYNDNLPAWSQPQSPARLPRNGLPAMSLQNPVGIGAGAAQTAPAGIGRRRRDSVRPTTPTRRGRNIEDQENLGVEVEARRRRVRETASREWEWEWDWEGDDEQDGGV